MSEGCRFIENAVSGYRDQPGRTGRISSSLVGERNATKSLRRGRRHSARWQPHGWFLQDIEPQSSDPHDRRKVDRCSSSSSAEAIMSSTM